MVPHSFLSAVLDLVGLASTATVVVRLVSGLQPLFERARDSCRACQPPEGRALLLWSAFLVHIAWMAAAALYFRNLLSLWDLMGTWLENQPVNRPVYALLHFYLFFLLVCGIYAWAITIFEISQNRKVFKDLFMIARFNTRKYQPIEDLETQHGSSSTDPIDTEAEIPCALSDVRSTSSLPQDEDPRTNGQESSGDVAPTGARMNEPQHPSNEAAWSGIDRPIGEIITRTANSPIRSITISSSRMGGGWNNGETTGPFNEHSPTLDSDGDAITRTPSSSTSNASSGSDEPEDDDNDRGGCQGVRLRKPRNTKPLCIIDQRGYIEGDCPSGLYYATPRLSPQDQNAETHTESFIIGEPPSPCDSCSSAHAESIPTAKRSPARVPITPTSPTADADDADTEKTDNERKQRERKNRNLAKAATQTANSNMSMMVPPCRTHTVLHGIDPNPGDNIANCAVIESSITSPALEEGAHSAGDDAENTRVQESNLAAQALDQRSTSVSPKPTPSPTPASALHTRPATPPRDQRDRETGLYRRSGQAAKADMPIGMRDEGGPLARPPPRRRPMSPYPFAKERQATGPEGGRHLRDLSLEIPDAGFDSHDGEGEQ
ncbi:MAG: hypothetical protein ASARMPRED_007507 [Alectoria sarmentosa]|nr:MAG: hypothetical protein ASARMPRED_007507 [Alectoria sarmentosa]